MRIIYIGGIIDGKKKRDSENSISPHIEKRWCCPAFPEKPYCAEYVYEFSHAVNLGEPIAYYFYKRPIVKDISGSEASLQQLAQANVQQISQQRASLNIFGL